MSPYCAYICDKCACMLMLMSKPATPRQYAYLTTLLGERDAAVTGVADVPALIAALQAKPATTVEVSKLIEAVTALPKAQGAAAPVRRNNYAATCKRCGHQVEAGAGRIEKNATTGKWDTYHVPECVVPEGTPEVQDAPVAGLYTDDQGTWYLVKMSKTGNPYLLIADAIVEGRKIDWQYVQGGMRSVLPRLRRATADEAAAIGHKTVHCCFCGIELSDEREGRSVQVGYGPICAGKNGLPWG